MGIKTVFEVCVYWPEHSIRCYNYFIQENSTNSVVDCTIFCRCMLLCSGMLFTMLYTLLILYGMYWFTLYHIASHLVCHHTALRAAL